MALPDAPPEHANGPDPEKHRRTFIVALAVILLVVFIAMVRDLLIGVILGIMLWTATRKLYQWILARMPHRPGWASGLAVLVTLLLVIVPMTAVLMVAAGDAVTMAEQAQDWFEPYRQIVQQQLDRLSRGYSVSIFGYTFGAQDVAQRIQAIGGQAGNILLSILQKTAGGILHGGLLLFITLYTLFFFYMDGPAFLGWAKRMLPLRPDQADRLIHDFLATAQSSLTTMIAIGAVQGVLGAVAFWAVGIPSPFFWGVIIALASVIPAVGAQIVLVPAAVIVMLTGKFWMGIGLLAWGWGVVGHVDNVLRPYLVKRAINLHQLLVLVSTLGGIAMFGFWGVILGPVIASLLKAVLHMYAEIYHKPPTEEPLTNQPKDSPL